jgi:murein L,D-transpeptidase YcbB/YkuD
MTSFSKKSLMILAGAVTLATATPALADRVVYDTNGNAVVVREQCATAPTVPYYNGSRYQAVPYNYRYGWNNNTAAIQTQLIQLGYWVGSGGANGVMNSTTRSAVKQFQREHGLKVDGVVGYNTSNVLNNRVSNMRYAQGYVQYPAYTSRYYR